MTVEEHILLMEAIKDRSNVLEASSYFEEKSDFGLVSATIKDPLSGITSEHRIPTDGIDRRGALLGVNQGEPEAEEVLLNWFIGQAMADHVRMVIQDFYHLPPLSSYLDD